MMRLPTPLHEWIMALPAGWCLAIGGLGAFVFLTIWFGAVLGEMLPPRR